MAEVTISRRYAAPPEAVFDAWLDPAKAGRFAFATPDGQMVRADIDPRVGGRYNFTDRRPDGAGGHVDVEHVGEYLEIDRPRRLVFTFGTPQYDPRMTTVIIQIAPADGGCELTLTHREVAEEWVDKVPEGWTMILEGLGGVLGG